MSSRAPKTLRGGRFGGSQGAIAVRAWLWIVTAECCGPVEIRFTREDADAVAAEKGGSYCCACGENGARRVDRYDLGGPRPRYFFDELETDEVRARAGEAANDEPPPEPKKGARRAHAG